MRSKKTITALCAAAVAALSLVPSAFGARGQGLAPQLWCPQVSGEPCGRASESPRFVPSQVRPRIQPALVKNRFGRDSYRSGGWLME